MRAIEIRVGRWSVLGRTALLALTAGLVIGAAPACSGSDGAGVGSPGGSVESDSGGPETGTVTPLGDGGEDGGEHIDGGAGDGGGAPGRVHVPGTYNLGMNVSGLTYYSNQALYADMALALSGNDGPWDKSAGSGAAALDANGNPTEAAWAGTTNAYPSGNYAVSWDGAGTVTMPGLGAVTSTTVAGVQHNTATLTFTQQLSTITTASWTKISVTPPIANLHIMAPAALLSPSGTFINDFVQRTEPFSTFRFMDALRTNGNLTQNWSQRSWPNHGSRAKTIQGMAYEDIIALANETGADVWINVPALATDDYVCRMARLFKYGEQGDMSNSACDPSAPAGTATTTPLNHQSKLYVEYSNEIWNYGFQQIHDIYCMANGVSSSSGGLCDVTAPTSKIATAALANTAFPWGTGYTKTMQLSFVLAKRVSDIFRASFGCTSGTGCQVQIPINVQAVDPAGSEPGFEFLKSAYGSVGSLDLMAVAPYFDTVDANDASDDSTVDSIFTDLSTETFAPTSTSSRATADILGKEVKESTKYSLPLVAYEGGESLGGKNATPADLTAQSDPRMFTAYQQYFALWGSIVGKDRLFNHYTFVGCEGDVGSFSALINQDDPGTQKWDALVSLTRLAGDANLDGVVDAADCTILKAHFGQNGQWWMQGDFNHDGSVDATDLADLNAHITGAKCTQ
jgi:hypothetical protein